MTHQARLRGHGVRRTMRTAARYGALAVACSALEPLQAVAQDQQHADFAVPATPATASEPTFTPPAAGIPAAGSMAQFQLPPAAQHLGRPERPVTQFLTYQYSYGSESDITYRRDRDLDKRLRDNALILAPQINGYFIYRPNDRVEMMVEMFLEKEIAAHEESIVTLPGGQKQAADNHRISLAVDQAWIKFKGLGPFELTVGRRNFEDDRHWLYDTSLDVIAVKFKHANFNAELSYGRKDLVNLDLTRAIQPTRTDNAMAYLEYRGIEDIKLAGYAIRRDDRTGQEGKALMLGLRAYGMPTDRFNFWGELAFQRGKDEDQKDMGGHAIDAGATYRFPDLPLHPNVTLGYATASGDADPRDNKNTEFRQSGLQSNEFKMGGVSKFKYYGEVLDPELSNLQILTVGVGIRPTTSMHVELVYHKYRANEFTDELRNWALTARMNQDPSRPQSKDVGSALDVVFGFRNLFGVRRLGLDLRAGLFFPGKAFRNEVTGAPAGPPFRNADKGISVLAKFWY